MFNLNVKHSLKYLKRIINLLIIAIKKLWKM